jgi:hypothetical protein
MTGRLRGRESRAARPSARGLALLAGLLLLAAPAASAPPAARRPPAPAAEQKILPRRVVAYYLHGHVRCATCRKLEAYAREAVESGFADELKDGRVVWRAIDFEDKGNEHYLKNYRLYTKSVILAEEVKGKQARWKNLSRVWQLLPDKAAFLRYVQDEVRAYLTPRA